MYLYVLKLKRCLIENTISHLMHALHWGIVGAEKMRFETKRDGDAVYMIVSGALSFSDCREWRRLIEAALHVDAGRYVLDLHGLEAIDSAGLGMMLNMREWAENQNKKVGIKLEADSVSANMIRLAKFDDWIVA